MASALDRDERGRMFSAAAALYVVVGVATGVLIALAALAIGTLDPRRRARPRRPRRRGGPRARSRRSASRRRSTWTPCAPSGCSCAAARHGDRGGGALPGADARADPRRGGPRLGDRLQRRDPAAERRAVGGRRAPLGRAGALRGGRRHARARDGDRADGRLAARRRALEPRDVRLQPRDPGRLPLALGRRPVRGARCAPTTSCTRWAARWRCRSCRRRRATWPPATSAGCASSRCAARATRSRCSCRCA